MSNDEIVSIDTLISKPVIAMELIGSRVVVSVISKHEKIVSGYLRTIDPVEGHLVIFDIDDEENILFTQIIIRRSVKKLKIVKRNACSTQLIDKLFTEKKSEVDVKELQSRKSNLIELIQANRLPYVENEDHSLFIASAATINPPYGIDDLMCKNDIVLKRLRQIIFSL